VTETYSHERKAFDFLVIPFNGWQGGVKMKTIWIFAWVRIWFELADPGKPVVGAGRIG
jgi:hypothetical protein